MKPFRRGAIAAIAVVTVVAVACSSQPVPVNKGGSTPAAATQQPVSPVGLASGTPVPSPSPTSANTPTTEASVVPNPLGVQLKKDNTRSVSVVVTSGGGTISADGADGTRFTLVIPPKSLRGPTTIKLTPVTAVEGLPLSGGLLASVQFEPDGLQFLQPATFTMELTAPIASDGWQVVGFAAHGDGSEFHLHPWEVDGRKVTMQLLHFSSGGAAKGRADEIARQLKRVPTSPGDQFDQELSAERIATLKTGRSPYDLLKKWYDQSLAPQMGSPSAELVDQFLNWYQQVKREKLEGRFTKEIAQAVEKLRAALLKDVQQAYEVCVDGNLDGLGGMLSRMQLLDRLTEIDLLSPLGLEVLLRRCATFDLTFDSRVSVLRSAPTHDTALVFHVQGQVPGVQFDRDSSDFHAQGNLELSGPAPSFTMKIPFVTCAASGSYSGNGTLQVYSPTLDLSGDQRGGWSYDVFVTIDPGIILQNKLNVTCSMDNTGQISDLFEQSADEFSTGFALLHKAEANDRGFLMTTWERGSGAVFARKIYKRSTSIGVGGGVSGEWREDTTLTLVHKPRK